MAKSTIGLAVFALRKGDRVLHLDHGVGTVTRVKQIGTDIAVWVRLDSSGIEGTCLAQSLRKIG